METMSLNVLERTREIAVMRTDWGIEGRRPADLHRRAGLIGVLSWLIDTILALPTSRILSDQVGQSFTQPPSATASP
jgi:putative ABC transport system permease protein